MKEKDNLCIRVDADHKRWISEQTFEKRKEFYDAVRMFIDTYINRNDEIKLSQTDVGFILQELDKIIEKWKNRIEEYADK